LAFAHFPFLLSLSQQRLRGITATCKLELGTSLIVAKETEQELRINQTTGAVLWMKTPRGGMTTACIAKLQKVDARAYHTFLAT
jgi:hypothetical protein